MRRIHREVTESRPERVVQVDLVDLVLSAREESVERICACIGVDVDPQMVDWFNANVTPAAAHHGRWRRDFDADTVAQVDEAYGHACERLIAEGVRIPQSC